MAARRPAQPARTAASTPPVAEEEFGKPAAGWRRALYRIVFESDTRSGQLFDVAVILAILLSVAVVMADSMAVVVARHGPALSIAEWTFTGLFTLEYLARLVSVQRPLRYALSFYGVIDLLSVLPTYLALLWPEGQLLIDVRVLRLLRVFRIFRLTEYMAEFSQLGSALHASRRKILVFLSFVLMVVLVMGTVMYVVEGPQNGFTSIPIAMYWAVTTMTTVGFGDITPHTDIGRIIASAMMLLGWGVLAVPTGIVTAEMTAQRRDALAGRAAWRCAACRADGHPDGARFCWRCGVALDR
ncbi:MAG TPA: ion transporter [Ideonella sp.]|uniref:ion transporter n=1 Tax=Ideonella sp. TaxID=1929293 RepID=UPI002E2FB539|nr:ion transporter [Ideonella sp.]HEX5682829.1 ion transporter [Ideonella sp.]